MFLLFASFRRLCGRAMKSYTYSPLEKSHIRLLHLSVTHDGTLKATVKHVRLHPEATVVYNGLSHIWGSSESIINLVCDGKWLPITKTLATALSEYIKCYPNEPLWIDQICISQMDHIEKSEQVKMMNLIFESRLINLLMN